MKLDREKFLAAALLLGAASVTAGCSKSSGDAAPVKDEAAPRPLPVQVQPPSTNVVPPSREGVAPPAKEGAVPPPAQEGRPTGSRMKIVPKVGGGN